MKHSLIGDCEDGLDCCLNSHCSCIPIFQYRLAYYIMRGCCNPLYYLWLLATTLSVWLLVGSVVGGIWVYFAYFN